MSDDELIEKAKGTFGFLYAHGARGYIDTIGELCERYAASRAEAERLRGEWDACEQELKILRESIDEARDEAELSALIGLLQSLDAATTDTTVKSTTG